MPLPKESRIQMPIEAYKIQKIKSILKGAQLYAAPEKTLHARLKGRESRTETRANGHRLTDFEE
jgi:hypothetical protein